MGIIIASQSVWPLDGRYNFTNTTPTTGSSLGEGLLQNNYSFLTSSGLSNFTSSISYFYSDIDLILPFDGNNQYWKFYSPSQGSTYYVAEIGTAGYNYYSTNC